MSHASNRTDIPISVNMAIGHGEIKARKVQDEVKVLQARVTRIEEKEIKERRRDLPLPRYQDLGADLHDGAGHERHISRTIVSV